jgi:hypothetical protein
MAGAFISYYFPFSVMKARTTNQEEITDSSTAVEMTKEGRRARAIKFSAT